MSKSTILLILSAILMTISIALFVDGIILTTLSLIGFAFAIFEMQYGLAFKSFILYFVGAFFIIVGYNFFIEEWNEK